MSITELRERMRAAVNSARFESSLPSGECDEATVDAYLERRSEEIVAAARGALDERAPVYSAEVILRILYGKDDLSDVTTEYLLA